LIEQRDAEDATKLKVLREAARVGVAALDRGEFKEFENIESISQKILKWIAENFGARHIVLLRP
jgi:hypothetical protein